ncbi:hypothetical protein ACFFV7_50395 [Nonomuraea spiralis]|uniref:Uncharacterized protein n=1 Tax=Nonomuraea spiralis TaxID=46182 RepID=A0ABV5J0G9_9ACTN|nr:hypothetical protein [Nonomuraea spiralis]GGS89303.1 hypothetical protein GCM10010176_036470 [Nonomuraea spiralis]
MDLKNMMARVIDELYSGLTGGDAEIPLPGNMVINFIQPGMVFHPSEFDFAVAGPFSGPSPLTLDFFRKLAETIQGDNPEIAREEVIKQAKAMYQGFLLGTWENWSRLVDFIPLVQPGPAQHSWRLDRDQGRQRHAQVVYGQEGRTLSQVYGDVLSLCEVADDELSPEKLALIQKMRALLQETVETTDFLTGEKRTVIQESRILKTYADYRTRYENAVIDYAGRLARSQSGSAADLIEWSRSGGIYRSRAQRARADWEAQGYKNDVERAQAVLDQILGTSMVQWVAKLRSDVDAIEDNVQGAFGYPFFPATVVPGSFARNDGWTTFKNLELHSSSQYTASSRGGAAHAGFPLGIVNFSGGGSAGQTETDLRFKSSTFGMEFEYTQVEIVRPWFNPGFFASRGWRLKTEFVDRYRTDRLSDGKAEQPAGALVGYPTKALFVRNLTFHSSDLAGYMHTKRDDIVAGGAVAIGPFVVGGGYHQSRVSRESAFDLTDTSITMRGLQLVAFMSALTPMGPDPSPNVKKWL